MKKEEGVKEQVEYVHVPGTGRKFRTSIDGFTLNVAVLEHGINLESKITQIRDNASRVRDLIWHQGYPCRLLKGVSYFGSDAENTLRGLSDLDFRIGMTSLFRVEQQWSVNDSQRVAETRIRRGISAEDIHNFVLSGEHTRLALQGRRGSRRGWYDVLGRVSEMHFLRLLEKGAKFVGYRGRNYVGLFPNAHLGLNKYGGPEIDAIMVFYRSTNLVRLLRYLSHENNIKVWYNNSLRRD